MFGKIHASGMAKKELSQLYCTLFSVPLRWHGNAINDSLVSLPGWWPQHLHLMKESQQSISQSIPIITHPPFLKLYILQTMTTCMLSLAHSFTTKITLQSDCVKSHWNNFTAAGSWKDKRSWLHGSKWLFHSSDSVVDYTDYIALQITD